MEDLDPCDLIQKLQQILITLQRDIAIEKRHHLQEVQLLHARVAKQEKEIQALQNQIKSSLSTSNPTLKDNQEIRKPLFARKISEIVTYHNTDCSKEPDYQTEKQQSSKGMMNSSSMSFLLNSRGQMVCSVSSMEKSSMKGSGKKKQSKAKQDPKRLKIDILNKQNKEPLVLVVKSPASTTSSRGQVARMLQRAQQLNSKKKSLNKSTVEAMLSKDKSNKMTQSKQEKKFINVYLPTKGPLDRPEWR